MNLKDALSYEQQLNFINKPKNNGMFIKLEYKIFILNDLCEIVLLITILKVNYYQTYDNYKLVTYHLKYNFFYPTL